MHNENLTSSRVTQHYTFSLPAPRIRVFFESLGFIPHPNGFELPDSVHSFASEVRVQPLGCCIPVRTIISANPSENNLKSQDMRVVPGPPIIIINAIVTSSKAYAD